MPPKDDDDNDNDQKVEVDIEALKKFGGFLLDRGAEFVPYLDNLVAINVVPGNEKYFKEAGALKTAVTTRSEALQTMIKNLRDDLEQLGTNMAKIASLYENAKDDAKAEAEGLLPLITNNKTVPAATAPPPPPVDPPNT